jgi:hypothetical protein
VASTEVGGGDGGPSAVSQTGTEIQRLASALALLVLWIGADHHDPAVATDHPALVAHFLD